MSNESIRDIDPKQIWVRGGGVESGSDAEQNPFERGHPDEIEDVVSIGAPFEVVEKLKSAKELDKILGLIGLQEEEHEKKAREEVYKYEKLLGEQLEENYIIEAARAAILEMISPPKGDLTDHEIASRMFSSLFAEKIREKELNPFNTRDTEGEGKKVVEVDS